MAVVREGSKGAVNLVRQTLTTFGQSLPNQKRCCVALPTVHATWKVSRGSLIKHMLAFSTLKPSERI